VVWSGRSWRQSLTVDSRNKPSRDILSLFPFSDLGRMTPLSAALARWRNWRLSMRIETLALVASIFFALACNGLFWRSSFAGREFGQLGTWLFAGELFVAAGDASLHSAQPDVQSLDSQTPADAAHRSHGFCTYYMSTFTVFLDPSMLRNVLAYRRQGWRASCSTPGCCRISFCMPCCLCCFCPGSICDLTRFVARLSLDCWR
jgi:hypothetical protein